MTKTCGVTTNDSRKGDITMKASILRSVILCAVLLAGATGAFAQGEQEIEGQKLAQTGMKFLTQSVDARAAALGTAVTAVDGMGASAMFYNPASMARTDHTAQAWLGRSQWIADINYNAISAAFQPAAGRYGVFGLSLMSVDYGDFQGTIRADNESGYLDTDTFSPTALAVGVGYAKAITDRFDVGAHVKYATQDMGASTIGVEGSSFQTTDRSVSTLAYDFGVLYRTGFRNMNFAVNIRNFASELVYVEESFELPLTVSIGFAIDAMQLAGMNSDQHAFLLTTDLSHPRDFAEQVTIGGEYLFMNILALRAGYVFPADEHGISLGAGLQTPLTGLNASINYAHTPFGVLGDVNRFSVAIAF